MTKVITQVETAGFLLHLRPVVELTDDQLFELCQINQDLWNERTAEGDFVIMPPEGWETGSMARASPAAHLWALFCPMVLCALQTPHGCCAPVWRP